MTDQPEKPINLLWSWDEAIIALQRICDDCGGWLSRMDRRPASRESPATEHLTNKEPGPCCTRVARNKWQ